MATGSAKWSLKIAREWSRERVQWGKPVGKHEAVATKLAFMAATTYALEAVLELSGQMADEGRNDIRIEAALAKLWSSEMGCVIADELMQIRGGRGYETAESLAARGERAVPVEQVVRDLRINRIFEGSSEIMRLLIAREAVDAHLTAAGDLANPKADLRQKAKAAAGASGFYAKWLPKLVFGEGQRPTAYSEFGRVGDAPAFRRTLVAQAGPQHLLRDGALAGQHGAKAGIPGAHRGHRCGVVRDVCGHVCGPRPSGLRIRSSAQQAYELADAFCQQATLRVEALFEALWTNTDSTDVRLADNVLEGRYTWLEEGIIDQSEGTGPWIAHWEPGPATEPNLARRFLTVSESVSEPNEAKL